MLQKRPAEHLAIRHLPSQDEGLTTVVRVNLAESPLCWLHARGKLSDRQFAAGEQLRKDYEHASLGPRVTMNWGAAPIGHQRGVRVQSLDQNERQMAAKVRFDGAMCAAGAGLSDILWRCVCDGISLPVAERMMKWPARSGRIILTLALDRVADHYRLP